MKRRNGKVLLKILPYQPNEPIELKADIDGSTLTVEHPEHRVYTFDHILPDDEEVHDVLVHQVLDPVFDGEGAVVFCYGENSLDHLFNPSSGLFVKFLEDIVAWNLEIELSFFEIENISEESELIPWIYHVDNSVLDMAKVVSSRCQQTVGSCGVIINVKDKSAPLLLMNLAQDVNHDHFQSLEFNSWVLFFINPNSKTSLSSLEIASNIKQVQIQEYIGTIGQEYSNFEEIGSGGFGVVYKATALHDGSLVAIKITKNRDGFREPHILNHLKEEGCKFVVKLINFHTDPTMNVEVLEYGTPLDKFVQCHVISVGFLRWILYCVLRGLQEVRRCGYVHMDVKPANLLVLQPDDEVVLCDFGISCPISSDGMVWETAGTDTFVAPEVLKAAQTLKKPFYGERADVFSLGKTIDQIRRDENLHDDELEDMIRRMTRQDPKQRPHLYELIAEVEKYFP
jgi:hypothetical protein